MNILVSCMGYDSGKSGISSYMRSVVEKLKDCGHNITLVLEHDAIADFQGFEQIVAPKKFSKSALGSLWHMFCLPFIARRKRYDCLLILAANRRYVAFSKIPTIAVVHDLSQYRVMEKYDALRMFYLTKVQPYFGKKFSSIAAISMSTKEDVEKFWKIAPEKVVLNYNGLNLLKGRDDRVFEKLGIKNYIYYVSRIEHPGKNHMGLIKAYEALPSEIKSEYKLVLTGNAWNGAEIVKKYAEESADSKNIIFTGFVTDEELSSLYKNASVFAFPSFSEGFGLPLIEAMSSKVPCVCSNTSALGEIGKGVSLQFNPENIDEIKDCLYKALTDKALVADLTQKAFEKSKQFDWQLHADTLIEMCRKEFVKNSCLNLFGIKFVNSRIGDVVKDLNQRLASKIRTKVAFLNTHYLNTAYENKDQLERMRTKFDVLLPDGSGVSTACKIMRYRYRDNLNGTDLLPRLCELSEKHGYSMYFFAGKEGVAKRAIDNLLKTYPKMNVVGLRNGYYKPDELAGIIENINAAKPDMLFIGFGAPLQEKWVVDNFDKVNSTLTFAIGGVCDVYSGDLFRVSPWLRKHGLEWLGRFYQDPIRLFGRYAIGNPLFVLRVIKFKLFGKKD